MFDNMKSLNVIYKYGHFYDKETGKRIIIKDSTELAIVISSNTAMLPADPLNLPNTVRSIEEFESNISSLKGFKRMKKILDKGSKLSFTISSEILTSDPPEKYTIKFGLTLIEDLYIYETSKISLSKSYCVVDEMLQGNLPYFEPLHAYSLNEAHHKTFVHFFNKFGHATANAFTKFSLPNGNKLESLKQF